MLRAAPVLVALLAFAGPRPTDAQQLRGRLLDLHTDGPIAVGVVTLLAADGMMIAASITDSLGNWRLTAPGAGSYLIAARRIGYEPWTAGPVDVDARADLQFLFHLRQAPVQLTPSYTVAGAVQRQLELVGFYERQKADFGFFLAPEAIEKRQAARISDLLLGLPGVRLVWTGSGSAGAHQIQLRAGNLTPGGVCRPRIFVDGVIFARGDSRRAADDDENPVTLEHAVDRQIRQLEEGLSLDDIGPASNIAAIEIYRSASQVPVQFGGASVDTSCGVIVIWTRRGTPRGSR